MAQTEMAHTEAPQEVYRSLFEAAPDAILAIDPHGRIALWNPEAEKLFGYSAEEMRGSCGAHPRPAGGRGHREAEPRVCASRWREFARTEARSPRS